MHRKMMMTIPLSIAMIACASHPSSTAGRPVLATDLKVLQAPHDPNAVALTAQAEGIVGVTDQGCITLTTNGSTLNVILPSSMELWVEGGFALGLTQPSTGEKYEFGKRYVLGGGSTTEAPAGVSSVSTRTACLPPYFAISEMRAAE